MSLSKRVMSVALMLMLSVATCFALTGCSGLSPKETVKQTLEGVKAADSSNLSKYYLGDSDSLKNFSNEALASETSDTMSESQKAMFEKMKTMMLDFEYEIGDETIDGDNATVEVKLTTYEFGNAFYNAFSNYLSKAFALAFSGASQEQMTELFCTEYTAQLDQLTEKNCVNTVTFNLKKEDNQWKVCAFDDKINDALLGNLSTKVDSLNNSLGNNAA